MPTYEDIREYFNEHSQLREITSLASQVPIVTGFTLSIDPLWSFLHDLSAAEKDQSHNTSFLDRFDQENVLRSFDRYLFTYANFAAHPYYTPAQLLPHGGGYRRRDLRRAVGTWDRISKRWKAIYKQNRLPLILTIVHRPITPPLMGKDSSPEEDALQNLLRIVQTSPVAVHVEERQTARFSFATSDQIQTSG